MTAKTQLDKLVHRALLVWIDWLRNELLPLEKRTAATTDDSTYESDYRPMPKVDGFHSDPMLMRMIAIEERGTSWPITIHALICDMEPHWRVSIFAVACRGNLDEAAGHLGVSIHQVQTFAGHARSSLGVALAGFAHVESGVQTAREERRLRIELGEAA